MALSSAHALGRSFQTGALIGVPSYTRNKWCDHRLPCLEEGKAQRQLRLPVRASKNLLWGFDEKVPFGGQGVQLKRPNKRDVRVGAKWLHGLKGESKTGGTGSSGSTIFERLGEAGSSKSSTAATAVRDSEGNSENGRASLRVEDDFDEDAYAEEEEDEDTDDELDERIKAELEASLRATQRKPENGAAKTMGEAATQEEQSKTESSASGSGVKESEIIAEYRLGMDTMRKGMEGYFTAVYTVAKVLPEEDRKAFLETIQGNQMIDIENALVGDKDDFALGLEGAERQAALDLLKETANRIQKMVKDEAEKLEKDTTVYTIVNDRIEPKTPDSPPISRAELEAFVGRTLQEASYLSSEAMMEATARMDDVPRFPNLPLQKGAFDDVENEEELRQKIAEQKLLMYGEAEAMRQELYENRELFRKSKEARAAAGKEAEDQNGRPTNWPQWKDGGDRFDVDAETEKKLELSERVIEQFEAQIEEEFGRFERSLGLRPANDTTGQGPGEQDYAEIVAAIEKVREDLEEGLRADEVLGVPHLKKPLAESELADMEQTYREMIESAEDMEARGEVLPAGAFKVMDSLSGAIALVGELVESGRIEVVRDRDYLDALRTYEAAREGGSEDDDYTPVSERLPKTPEEVLTAIEDGISSLDYTLSVLNDNERRPLTSDEVIEMQVMDEGVVQWRDKLLSLLTNQTQVTALKKLDSLIDRTRPFYMVGEPRPLRPFTGFSDPNAAAVANAWADLIGDKEPVSTEEAVTSAWGALFDDASSGGVDSAPTPGSPREESLNGAAKPSENGAADSAFAEPTGSAKMDNVMTIGNGIQLDLGAAQADRLTAAPGGANFREGDPS